MVRLPAANGVSDARHVATVGVIFALFVTTTIVAHRQGARLSFDGYYYLEHAKLLRHQLPASFGNHWPFGWPAVGALISGLGLSAYHALVAAGFVAVAGLVLLSSRLLFRVQPWLVGFCLLAASVTLPIFGILTIGILSEVPFACILLGFAVSLAYWPHRGAILAAAALALAALAIRYVGIVLFPLAVLWCWLKRDELRRANRLREVVLVLAASSAVAGGLLGWNRVATGYFGGAERGSLVPLPEIPSILSDFGWSWIDACSGLLLHQALPGDGAARLLLGLACFFVPLALILRSLLRSTAFWETAVAATALFYALGFVSLRCIGSFDSLSPRIAVPLLFPLLLLLAAQSRRHPALLLTAALVCCGVNAAHAWRGVSLHTGADMQKVARLVVPLLQPGDSIGINDYAFTLAAVTDAPVSRVGAQIQAGPDRHRFLVFAADALNRRGDPGILPPTWEALAGELVRQDRFRVLHSAPDLVVLERWRSKQ